MILSKTEQADVHIWIQHDLLTPELTIPHSIELHLKNLHFTFDYTLYNLLCDK